MEIKRPWCMGVELHCAEASNICSQWTGDVLVLSECVLVWVSAAVGCPDFTVPLEAELKREGDRVTVTCKADPSRSWQRKCVGSRWEGELGTCPGSYATGAVSQAPGPLPIGKHPMPRDYLLWLFFNPLTPNPIKALLFAILI